MKERDIVISLFDFTGHWSKPWRDAGFYVSQVDIKLGLDIFSFKMEAVDKDRVYAILAAVPCTDFAVSGARHFDAKDSDGRTERSNALVSRTREIIEYFNPPVWAIENPVSRIHKLNTWMGEPAFRFQPWEFAGYDPVHRDSQYQKTTCLWGRFTIPMKYPLRNIDGMKLHNRFGGGSERTKEARSVTPLGFAIAFYEANKKRTI